MTNQLSLPPTEADAPTSSETVDIKDPIARPKIDGETLAKYKGRVLAICKSSGEIVADAANVDKLNELMASEFSEVQYRKLTCP